VNTVDNNHKHHNLGRAGEDAVEPAQQRMESHARAIEKIDAQVRELQDERRQRATEMHKAIEELEQNIKWGQEIAIPASERPKNPSFSSHEGP